MQSLDGMRIIWPKGACCDRRPCWLTLRSAMVASASACFLVKTSTVDSLAWCAASASCTASVTSASNNTCNRCDCLRCLQGICHDCAWTVCLCVRYSACLLRAAQSSRLAFSAVQLYTKARAQPTCLAATSSDCRRCVSAEGLCEVAAQDSSASLRLRSCSWSSYLPHTCASQQL